ncbi:MAG: hypothetical protein QM726_09270 [Chitinophagaceae bacterium]
MKPSTLTRVLAIFLLIISMASCQKTLNDFDNSSSNNPNNNSNNNPVIVNKDSSSSVVSFPNRAETNCPGAPDYGDSIIYLQPSSNDYIVTPVNHPDTGTYFAWPQGMSIDKNTGAINVTRSEGGLRYSVGYVKKGTTDTCIQTLILGGVSYEDSLYVLNSNQRYANPYFDADPNLTSICNSSNGSGGNTCAFDLNGQLASQHIIIDHNTGVIDLKNTASSAFGLVPLNGTTVNATMLYQLNDRSNLAPQQITLTFVYYNKKSDVPADLLTLVSDKLTKTLNQLLLINLPTSSSQQNRGNPRPPIIIVTRSSL